VTLTRVRLDRCSTKGCPAPFDEEWHRPWCRGLPEHECFGGATHQHWPKRSQGGKEIVACLCAGMHDAVDNGSFYGNAVVALPDGTRYFRLWNIWNETLIERVLGTTGEGETRIASGVGLEPPTLPSPAVVSASGPLAGKVTGRSLEPAEATATAVSPGGGVHSVSSPPLRTSTGEGEEGPRQREAGMSGPPVSPLPSPAGALMERGMRLRYKLSLASKIALETAFEVGDWACEVEDSLGEEAHSYFAVFSYWQVAKWASVARRVPLHCRVTNVEGISMEHHRAVANRPPEEQRALLVRAGTEHLSAAQIKVMVTPWASREPKPKCWTLEELREAEIKWQGSPDDGNGFLDWLAERRGERESKPDTAG